MTPTPNLQDLVQSVRDEVPDGDLLGQLSKAAEYSASLNTLGDRLLDHFVFQCRQAGMSWAELSGALGVSKQAAHKRFNSGLPNLQRFTPKAKAVMQGSIDQARALGHTVIGTEHMLLAIFEPADSVAALALRHLGVHREAVLGQILELAPGQPEPTEGAIPRSEHAKAALSNALDEAIGLGHNYIGTEHMLLGMSASPEYTSMKILATLGQTKQTLRDAVLEVFERIVRARADDA